MLVGGAERCFFLLSQTLQWKTLINHQTNWVWGSLPLLSQWKCFVWKSCVNYTRRHSYRDKSAPGCPKSSCFSLPGKLLKWQQPVCMFWSRLCTGDRGTALSKDVSSEEWLSSPTQTDRLHQCDRPVKSDATLMGRSWWLSAQNIGFVCCSSPTTGADSEVDFPITSILHLWHFGKSETVSWKKKKK